MALTARYPGIRRVPAMTACLLLLLLALLAPGAARAQGRPDNYNDLFNVDVTPDPPKPPALPQGVQVEFRNGAPGHLYKPAQQPEIAAVITSDVAQEAKISALVTTAYGATLSYTSTGQGLPAREAVTVPITFANANRLPNGTYKIELWVMGTKSIGSATTTFSVWNGPLAHGADCVGLNYTGSLATEQTWRDLDLFRQIGIGWLRFPLQGWLSQGQAVPKEAEEYNAFVREAAKRDFQLLAAFSPKLTVDPSVNGIQASKEYRESLMAAATRYGFKVKDWELLTVPPDKNFPGLTGVRFKELAEYAPALKGIDKTLHAVYSIEHPFRWNAIELFNENLPAKDDALGLRYNFVGIPEFKAQNTPPMYALDEVAPEMNKALKRAVPMWVTDYGFDPVLGDRLPEPPMQAALMARALLLARAMNFKRAFWRAEPTGPMALADEQGVVKPSYLALRTTMEMLDGVTQVTDVPNPTTVGEAMPRQVWTLLLRYDPPKKERKAKPRYVLATWKEGRDSRETASITLQTSASHVTVTDMWGNSIELQPTSHVCVFTVDAFPRFIDLGEFGDAQIFSPFARYDPPYAVLSEGGTNFLGFEMHNDQRLFKTNITCQVYFRRWPGAAEVKSEKFDLGPADSKTIGRPLTLPKDARRGQLYDVSAEIMLGTRRIGYITVPVWYIPKTVEPDPKKVR